MVRLRRGHDALGAREQHARLEARRLMIGPRLDEAEFILDRSITQAVATLAPVCFILSPLLTGGKVFAK